MTEGRRLRHAPVRLVLGGGHAGAVGAAVDAPGPAVARVLGARVRHVLLVMVGPQRGNQAGDLRELGPHLVTPRRVPASSGDHARTGDDLVAGRASTAATPRPVAVVCDQGDHWLDRAVHSVVHDADIGRKIAVRRVGRRQRGRREERGGGGLEVAAALVVPGPDYNGLWLDAVAKVFVEGRRAALPLGGGRSRRGGLVLRESPRATAAHPSACRDAV